MTCLADKLILFSAISLISLSSMAVTAQNDRPVLINGFGTVGITSADSKESPPDSLSSSEVNWGEFTRLGINFSKRLDSEFMGVFQLLGVGNNQNFNVDVDLVHLIYRPVEKFTFVLANKSFPLF